MYYMTPFAIQLIAVELDHGDGLGGSILGETKHTFRISQLRLKYPGTMLYVAWGALMIESDYPETRTRRRGAKLPADE